MEETMPEAEAKTKETEELSIEVEEPSEDALTDEPEVEQQKTVAKTDELEPKPEESTEELEKYSENVNKRIGKLTAKLREAERREKAATEYAQSVQKELEENQKKTLNLDSSYLQEFGDRIKFQEEALKSQLKLAIDRDDVDKQTEIQKALADLAVDNNRLNFAKSEKEKQEKETEVKPEQNTAQAQVQQQPDPKAQEWANKNTWFGSDEPMTLTAFSIHKKLIETEGYDGKSDEYYAEIDKRMREEFPHKFDDVTETKSNGRATPPVGGATRGNQRGNQVKIKLNKSEVAIARKLGITNEQYARQKARMQPQS
tara:strand:- start:9816 stop:10757 length:942 start_codon:yes stop_codon:yes gene_type:complete